MHNSLMHFGIKKYILYNITSVLHVFLSSKVYMIHDIRVPTPW